MSVFSTEQYHTCFQQKLCFLNWSLTADSQTPPGSGVASRSRTGSKPQRRPWSAASRRPWVRMWVTPRARMIPRRKIFQFPNSDFYLHTEQRIIWNRWEIQAHTLKISSYTQKILKMNDRPDIVFQKIWPQNKKHNFWENISFRHIAKFWFNYQASIFCYYHRLSHRMDFHFLFKYLVWS